MAQIEKLRIIAINKLDENLKSVKSQNLRESVLQIMARVSRKISRIKYSNPSSPPSRLARELVWGLA